MNVFLPTHKIILHYTFHFKTNPIQLTKDVPYYQSKHTQSERVFELWTHPGWLNGSFTQGDEAVRILFHLHLFIFSEAFIFYVCF